MEGPHKDIKTHECVFVYHMTHRCDGFVETACWYLGAAAVFRLAPTPLLSLSEMCVEYMMSVYDTVYKWTFGDIYKYVSVYFYFSL